MNDATMIEININVAITNEAKSGLLIFIGVFLTNCSAENIETDRNADLNKLVQII
nr:MAG TPA: hypothetical protein [Caudoviricetes sp.]